MNYEELARQILGVAEDADKEEIVRAARRLLLRHHPDQGGTSLRARCVLSARATLLRGQG